MSDFTCDKCGRVESMAEQVRLIIEGDRPDDTGTRLVLCRRCGMDATLMIANEWMGNKRRPYLEAMETASA